MSSFRRGVGFLVRIERRKQTERRHRSWATLLALGLGFGFLSARLAQAETTDSAPAMGVAIHPEVGFALPTPSGSGPAGPGHTPGIYTFGISGGYELTQRYEVELGLGYSGAGSRAAMPVPGDSRDNISTPPGLFIRGLGRARFGASWIHAVVGAGPAMFVGAYGVVPLVDVEAGIEFRARRGLYLLIAYQLLEPILRSRQELDPARCVTDDCPGRFNPADPIVGMRLALGASF
jgi:hypothetical protein